MSADVRATYRFARLPEWIIFHTDLTPIDIRVYAALDRFDGGNCFPALETLGERLDRTDRSIRTSIRRLELAGAITVEERFEHGRQTSNRFILAGEQPLKGGRKLPGARTKTSATGQKKTSGEPEQEEPERELTSFVLADVAEISASKKASKEEKDALFDAICEVCGVNSKELTKTAASGIAKVRNELLAAGATPDEIGIRAEVYKHTLKGCMLTPQALGKWWASLEEFGEQSNTVMINGAAVARSAL